MQHLSPNDSVVDGNWPNTPVVDGNWPNDSHDHGNTLPEPWRTVLIEVGIGWAPWASSSSTGWPPRCSCTSWHPSCSDLGRDQLHALAVLGYWFGDLEVVAVLERDSSWPRDATKTGSSTRQPAGPAPSVSRLRNQRLLDQ